MTDESTTSSAVYMGWTTFLNSLNSLSEGMPTVIDKSVFAGQSGGVQSQLMAGLKFLGLIGENGSPTTDLVAVAVTDEPARKEALKRILQQRYSALFALDLTKTTSAQLYEKIAEVYNVSGDTREKAVRFFLAAVQYAGVPVGRFLLQSKAANGGASRKRRVSTKGREADIGVEDDDSGDVPPPAQAGTSRTVTLKSGGTLTVTASMDVFKLSPGDRTFVFALIDKLAEYEGQGA